MSNIIQITVGLTESVNTAPYTYIKPEISLTAEVTEGESYDDVFNALNLELKERMAVMVAQIEADN